MPWTSDIHDAAAGRMLELLDALLVAAHGTWSIYDTFGTNNKVYRCLDLAHNPPIDFYIHVDDNYADFCKIYMYDSWDIGSHSYLIDTGCKVIWGSSASYYPVICKKASGYYFSSHDYRFIYVDKAEWAAHYVGMLGQVDGNPAVQNPLLWVGSSGYAAGYNPLGYYSNSGNDVVARFMQTALGSGMVQATQNSYTSSAGYYRTIDGGICVRPSLVFDWDSRLIQGYFINVFTSYNNAPLNNDDSFVINGSTWRYIEGTGGTRSASIIKQE